MDYIKVIDGVPRVYKSVVVHRFSINAEDDPDLFAGESLYNWEISPQGAFIKDRAVDVKWQRRENHLTFAYEYIIIATLEEKHLSEFYLKWSNLGSN